MVYTLSTETRPRVVSAQTWKSEEIIGEIIGEIIVEIIGEMIEEFLLEKNRGIIKMV